MMNPNTQRIFAERINDYWNTYLSIPICVEQCMTWGDQFDRRTIKYAIRTTARKQAKMMGQMSLPELLAYCTATMRHHAEEWHGNVRSIAAGAQHASA